jgi:hypothetical protein
MTEREIECALRDFGSLGPRGDGELSRIEAAIFLEDCLGLVIGDREIIADNLGDAESIRRFALGKLEV